MNEKLALKYVLPGTCACRFVHKARIASAVDDWPKTMARVMSVYTSGGLSIRHDCMLKVG